MLAGFFALLSMVMLGLGTLSGCGLDSGLGGGLPEDPKALARVLYDQAWTMIRDEYVDESFNQQDWRRWRHRYDDRLQDPEDAYVAIETMIASLNDQYTRFLGPRAMSEQTMSIDSKLYGIGIQISARDNKLLVVSVIEGTPAEKAAMMSKDIITQINGHETAGMSVEDAADRIRGAQGTYVTLTIKRGEQTLSKRIMRDEIKLKSVFTKDLDNKRIGYIRLNSFISETMLAEMQEALAKMEKKEALILDLRGNYGGLLTNATELADLLMERGDIVSIVNRDAHRRVIKAQAGSVYRGPIAVLIDGGSASASEILSGALKDNRRAILIGSQSFGKGLVQKINTLPDGTGLNITVSRYLTPDGVDINKKGIAPDVTVPFTEEDFLARRDPQLERAVRYLENKLVARK